MSFARYMLVCSSVGFATAGLATGADTLVGTPAALMIAFLGGILFHPVTNRLMTDPQPTTHHTTKKADETEP